jgi:hypothetical protein
MATKKDARKELIDFIDKKAFDKILKTSPDDYEGKNKEAAEEVIKKTKAEQKKFHGYKSAEEVKKNFLENVHSKPAKKLNKEIEHLGLPTLPQLKEDFEKLADKLEV